MAYFLGIESSCDDSSIAVINDSYKIEYLLTQSHLECSQVFQGIMPENVSREHVKYLPALIEKISKEFDLSLIEMIAYTAGPGLAGSLLVGAHLAHSLSLILNKPLVPVHHLDGHQTAYRLEQDEVSYPALSVIVSGGHTQLMILSDPFSFEIIGKTRDDAAGEAFDKIAKYTGLGFPGGPILAQKAATGQIIKGLFTIPMSSSETLDFSFSGLKTQAMRVWDDQKISLEDFCATIEDTIAQTICLKIKQSLAKYSFKSIILSGGVACNQKLRSTLSSFCDKKGLRLAIPSSRLCADNAAMIAAAGLKNWLHDKSRYQTNPKLSPLIRSHWPIQESFY